MVPESANATRRTQSAASTEAAATVVGHDAFVDAWLERSGARGLPREALVDLFEAALHALWARTSTTLGEVTLTAIADRVLHNAAERFPTFTSLRVDGNGRIHTGALRDDTGALHHLKLVEGMRSVLVEFLTVLGNLTAELLTPELQAELLKASRNGNGKPAAARPTRAGRPSKSKEGA